SGPSDRRWPTAEFARRGPDEDLVLAVLVQRPVVAFAGIIVGSGHFDEALVEGEIVPDRVLPALLVVAIVGVVGHDVVVDSGKCQSSLFARPNRHHNQCIVREGRLLVSIKHFLFLLCLLTRLRGVPQLLLATVRISLCRGGVRSGGSFFGRREDGQLVNSLVNFLVIRRTFCCARCEERGRERSGQRREGMSDVQIRTEVSDEKGHLEAADLSDR
ncbi:hypothetical protein PENTCL1PPCAC_28317, partial [Pristionchus entomophagus]